MEDRYNKRRVIDPTKIVYDHNNEIDYYRTIRYYNKINGFFSTSDSKISVKTISQFLNSNKQPLINFAAYENKPETVKELIQFKPNLDITDRYGLTPLFYCIIHKNYDLALFLLKRGANSNIISNFFSTPLSFAIYYGQLDMIELLLAPHYNFQGKENNKFKIFQDEPVPRLKLSLLRPPPENFGNLCDVDLPDYLDMTQLMWAVIRKNYRMIEFLLSKGARVSPKDIFGRNALFWSIIYWDEKIFYFLDQAIFSKKQARRRALEGDSFDSKKLNKPRFTMNSYGADRKFKSKLVCNMDKRVRDQFIKGKCVICQCRKSDTVLDPCSCNQFCRHCSISIRICPMCSSIVSNITHKPSDVPDLSNSTLKSILRQAKAPNCFDYDSSDEYSEEDSNNGDNNSSNINNNSNNYNSIGNSNSNSNYDSRNTYNDLTSDSDFNNTNSTQDYSNNSFINAENKRLYDEFHNGNSNNSINNNINNNHQQNLQNLQNQQNHLNQQNQKQIENQHNNHNNQKDQSSTTMEIVKEVHNEYSVEPLKSKKELKKEQKLKEKALKLEKKEEEKALKQKKKEEKKKKEELKKEKPASISTQMNSINTSLSSISVSSVENSPNNSNNTVKNHNNSESQITVDDTQSNNSFYSSGSSNNNSNNSSGNNSYVYNQENFQKVMKWSTEDVVKWLEPLGLNEQIIFNFKDQCIDGLTLTIIFEDRMAKRNEETLKELGITKVGERLKFDSYLKKYFLINYQ